MKGAPKTILDSIGQTPLVSLQRLSPNPEVQILAKVEFLNPSSSIKDRIVHYIIQKAEESGQLRKGGTIIENTSGNTGAAVAMIAAIRGYKAILTMPDKVSLEKQNAIKAFGAEIVVCPTSAGPDSPDNYVNTAMRLAAETENSYRLDQYDNPLNVEAHYHSTGPEIWDQTQGQVDYFVASSSTGGTISGTGRYLKERNPNIQVVLPDPVGSIYTPHFRKEPIPKDAVCSWKVEGVGEDHIAKAMDFSVVNRAMPFTDAQAFSVARRLAREEGILVGGSSGANVWACLEIAKEIDKSATIVTVLPDGGVKYLSKIYNDAWMKEMEQEKHEVLH